MNQKETLFKLCELYVNRRAQTVEKIMISNRKGLEGETKSSAGDKHETRRAMLQLEMEKTSQQLVGIQQMKETLAKIDLLSPSSIARLGSIVITNKANYFLSISAGKIVIDTETYFAISTSSPIGKILLGKQAKNQVVL